MKLRTNEIKKAVSREFDEHSYYVRKDLDAMNEGWDPMEHPEDSWIAQHIIKVLDIDEDEADQVYDILMEYFEEMQEDLNDIDEEEEE